MKTSTETKHYWVDFVSGAFGVACSYYDDLGNLVAVTGTPVSSDAQFITEGEWVECFLVKMGQDRQTLQEDHQARLVASRCVEMGRTTDIEALEQAGIRGDLAARLLPPASTPIQPSFSALSSGMDYMLRSTYHLSEESIVRILQEAEKD